MNYRNPILPYSPKLKSIARQLRKQMTPGEVILWQKLRNKKIGVQFHRQVPIKNYIVDFYCHELKLAIEIDGCSHDHPEVAVDDEERQGELEKLGVHFLRFDEREVKKEVDRVTDEIEQWIRICG